ncbi:MAG TPA: RecQ family ATP-dependent DNA helicase [Candidatus Nanoarchaeia archaeon]|nr:RecQ family ATP-dependent DNA helicase [Candidatus Nanoarchaeia archaeon]
MNNDGQQKRQAVELLKIHYGFDKFRPGQEEAIDAILDGKDVLVVMPTGGGKSLIFQLPALVLDGVAIVVSPLIALMKDQVDAMNQIGVPATFINSSISPDEAKERLALVKSEFYKLLYIAPERFYNDEFVSSLAGLKVKLFAVDEAHCISQWGHDFRPAYLRLNRAIELCGRPPIAALTATATPEVKEDILQQLGMTKAEKIITGFTRPNLQFGVIKATDSQKLSMIADTAESIDGCGIIYTGTRAKAEEITDLLLERGLEAVFYHAGMDPESRSWTQENFLKGKTKIIVATNAFGLGIDKKDVRFVIHHDMPGTIEAYYQEAGRAGRDGAQSLCLLFFAPKDRFLREFFIKGDNPTPETVLEIYEILTNYESDRIFTTYAELMENLSDKVPDMAVGTCLKILEKEGYIARSSEKTSPAFLRLVNNFQTTLDFVSKQAKKQVEILNKLQGRFAAELFAGWEFDLDEVAGIIEVGREALVRSINAWKKAELVEYTPPRRGTEIRILKRVPRAEIKIDFSAMRAKAARAYRKLDEMEDYVYHFGCRPEYILNYFGEYDVKRCGKCDNCLSGTSAVTHPASPGARHPSREGNRYERSGNKKVPSREGWRDASERRGVLSAEFDEIKIEKKTLNTKLTQLETLDLFNKNYDPAGIAGARGLTVNTIYEHLAFLVEKNLIKNIDKLVSSKKQDKIFAAIKKVGPAKLTPIREELGDDYSWEEIKIVRAKFKQVSNNK